MTVQNSQPIVERLRAFSAYAVCRDAADHIERLAERCAAYRGQVEAGAAEIATLKAALREMIELTIRG